MSHSRKHPQPTPRALLDLEIPDAVPIPWDAASSSLYGVGSAAINAGLRVFVEAYQDMAVGDRVEVLWDGSGLAFASVVVDSGNLNQRLGLTLAKDLFVEGDFQPFYRVKRISGQTSDSPSREIRVQLSIPGGADPNPSTAYNENLDAPQVAQDILLNGVDASQAAQGVDVGILPYANMAEYDRIDLSWGGQHLLHTVQPGEVGQTVTLRVGETSILAAGDGQISLMYQVIDAAANGSDGWSMVTLLNVFASGSVVDAPIVVDALNGELDLATLAGADAEVQVLATSEHFASGETVELFWEGTSEAGIAVTWNGSQTVSALPQVMSFAVPNASLAAIAGGSAVVYYAIRKSNGDLYSKRTLVQVVGVAQLLAAPTVREASGGSLPADVAQATVDIAPYLGMAAGDLVTLIWAGQKANGEPTDYRVDRSISGSGVGNTLTIVVPGTEQVAPLEGGSVAVWYQVTPFSRRHQRLLAQDSERLELSVGAATVSLPAPTVAEAENNVLAPDVLQATVEIAAYAAMAANDRVDMFWKGNVTGSYTDWLPVSSGSVGRSLTFTVYPEQIAANSSADVSYTVSRAAGGSDASLVLKLQIGDAVPLPAPSIDQAVGDLLDPADAPNGATVRIAPYAGMTAGDRVDVQWAGAGGNWSNGVSVSGGMVGNDLTLVVPAAIVQANDGNTVTVDYRLTAFAGGESTSQALILKVQSVPLLAAPTVDEAPDGELDPGSVPNGATVRIAPYTDMAAGDVVTAYWLGQGIEWSDVLPISEFIVGKAITFSVPSDTVMSSDNQQIVVRYSVARNSGAVAESEPFYLLVESKELLPPPSVDEAIDAVLDPADTPNGATVRIEPYENMVAGDLVTMLWDSPAGTWTDAKSISGGSVGIDVTFLVPSAQVQASLDQIVEISYSVLRFDGSEETSQPYGLLVQEARLPAPVIVEAYGDKLDPDLVLDGATVRIDETARFKTGDIVQVVWSGPSPEGSYDYPHTITDTEAGKALLVIIPYSVVIASNGFTIELAYYLSRTTGGELQSPVALYDVTRDLSTGTLSVMGRRYGRSVFNSGNLPRRLSAIDAQTLQPMLVEWQYDGDSEWLPGESFRDTDGTRPLHVRSADGALTLNPANISGTIMWEVGISLNNAAFAALTDSGSVVAWGGAINGGDPPSEVLALQDVVEVASTAYAMLARRANGSVVSWGDILSGGIMPNHIKPLQDIVQVASSTRSFAVRRANGQVLTWGALDSEQPGPAKDVVGTINYYDPAFALITLDGHVQAWGDDRYGGKVPADIASLSDIVEVIGNGYAFAARRANGAVVAWGSSGNGGSVPSAISSYRDIVEVISGTDAFAALRSNGTVVAWGDGSAATVPAVIASLDDIVEVSATNTAFAARRGNGQVVAWGDQTYGGKVPDAIAALTDIVQVTPQKDGFVALRLNGTTVQWGNLDNNMPSFSGCQAVYRNSHAWAALTTGGGVVTWGRQGSGGDSSDVQAQLNGKVSYLASPTLRGLARKALKLARGER